MGNYTYWRVYIPVATLGVIVGINVVGAIVGKDVGEMSVTVGLAAFAPVDTMWW